MNPRILSVVLLSTAAIAQGYAAFTVPVTSRPFPDSALAARETCVGELRGSGYLDHVSVSHGDVWLYSMPRYGGGVERLPGWTLTGATAVATRQRDTFAFAESQVVRRRDELFVSHASGLSRWWSDGHGHVETVSSALSSARQLLTADLDGNGRADIVGIGSNGHDVIVLMASGATGFAAPLSFRAAANVLAITTRHVGNETGRRVEIATDTGLLEMPAGFTGAPTTLMSAASTSSQLTTLVRRDGSELVAWVRRQGSGSDLLQIVPHPQAAVDLGALGVAGVAAGDVDADGDMDLVLSHQSSSCVTLAFSSDPGTTLFTRVGLGVIQLRLVADGESIPLSGHPARPIVADMNGDGLLDLALPLANDLKILEAINMTLAAQMPAPMYGTLTTSELDFHVNVKVDCTSALTYGYTHAEVLLWDLDYDAPTSQFVMQSAGRASSLAVIGALNSAALAFDGLLENMDSGGGLSVLWRAVRIETQNGVQTVTRVGPALGGYFVQSDYVELAGDLPNASVSNLSIGEEPSSGYNLGGIRQIGWVTIEPPPAGTGTGPN